MKLYNTLTRKVEEFTPINDKRVKIYTCGPTVYSFAHIGNFTCYVYWDLLVRTLQLEGWPVDRVLNITDVGHLTSDADDGTSPDDLYVFLPGENTIEYDSTSNYLELNDTTIVRTIAAEDATYEGVCSFKGQDAEDILIGEKKINDNSAIAVIYTVPSASDNDKTVDLNTEAENVQAILDNTTANAEITSGSLFGYSINPDWLENVVVTNEGCEFIKGESKIYAAPYVGSFADGTTNVLTAGNITLTYSDNIVDDSTGYKPYILSFDEVQDGTVKSDGTLKAKVLSKTNGQIKDFFMAE